MKPQRTRDDVGNSQTNGQCVHRIYPSRRLPFPSVSSGNDVMNDIKEYPPRSSKKALTTPITKKNKNEVSLRFLSTASDELSIAGADGATGGQIGRLRGERPAGSPEPFQRPQQLAGCRR